MPVLRVTVALEPAGAARSWGPFASPRAPATPRMETAPLSTAAGPLPQATVALPSVLSTVRLRTV